MSDDKGGDDDNDEGEGEDFLDEEDEEDEEEVKKEEEEKEPKRWVDVEEEMNAPMSSPAPSGQEGAAADDGAASSQAQQQRREDGEEAEEDEVTQDALGILSSRLMMKPEAVRKDETLRLDSDKFSAARYLGTVHRRTPFDRLTEGSEEHIKKKLGDRAEAIKNLVRSNFETFMRCKDVVDSMHAVVIAREVGAGGSGASLQLEASYEALCRNSARVFGKLMKSKEEAASIRALLWSLDKSKHVFRLPSALRQGAARGDDERVLSTWVRANELLGSSKNVLFARVLSECASVISGYRLQLVKVLQDPQSRMGDVEKAIGVLSQLSGMAPVPAPSTSPTPSPSVSPTPEIGDPVRYYLEYHCTQISESVTTASKRFMTETAALQKEVSAIVYSMSSISLSMARHAQLLAATRKKGNSLRAKARELTLEHVRKMSDLLCERVPPVYVLLGTFSTGEKPTGGEGNGGSASQGDGQQTWTKIPGLLGLKIRSQKQRSAKVLLESDGTWVTVEVRRNQTSLVLFQELMTAIRTGGAVRAKDCEYSLCSVLVEEGTASKPIELRPYERPYAVQKKWGLSKVQQNYFVMKKRSAQEVQKSLAEEAEAKERKKGEGAGAENYALSQDVVDSRISSLCDAFSVRVTEAYSRLEELEALAEDDTESLAKKNETVTEILFHARRCAATLRAQGLPGTVVSPLEKVLEDLRARFATNLYAECSLAVTKLQNSVRETQKDGCAASLTARFSEMVTEFGVILGKVVPAGDPFRVNVSTAITDICLAFLDALHSLVMSDDRAEADEGSVSPATILRALEDCHICRTQLFPQSLARLGLSAEECSSSMEKLIPVIEDLESIATLQYLRSHCMKVACVVRDAVAGDPDQWAERSAQQQSPSAALGGEAEVPDFVLSAFVVLVHVHSEVSETAPQFAEKTITGLLCMLLSALHESILALPSISSEGAVQLLAGVEFARRRLKPFQSVRSASLAAKCRDAISALLVQRSGFSSLDSASSHDAVEKMLKATEAKIRVITDCFSRGT